jgi:dTDP-4-dehydrorhamnose 3,5-epimerase
MKITDLEIDGLKFEGLKLVELDIYKDERGFFVERYNQKKFNDLGLENNFIQDNFSRSMANVVRGLHFQQNPAQAKLVSCLRGSIIDVAVDIRLNSPTFGKHFAVELTGENGMCLFVPGGFAHGFSVNSAEGADVLYKVDGAYNQAGEGCIKFDEPEFAINWQVKNPIVSKKDIAGMSFSEYKKSNLVF